jgi:hypothetical protein
MQQWYQARHANVEDNIREQGYYICKRSIPLHRPTVGWLQALWQITNTKGLGELVSGTIQVSAMTVFFEQFKFRRCRVYLTPIEPAANTYVAARHFFTSNLGLDLQDKVSRHLVNCNEHACFGHSVSILQKTGY